jgi:hypothetical protein
MLSVHLLRSIGFSEELHETPTQNDEHGGGGIVIIMRGSGRRGEEKK